MLNKKQWRAKTNPTHLPIFLSKHNSKNRLSKKRKNNGIVTSENTWL
jgi:hypothetical protein